MTILPLKRTFRRYEIGDAVAMVHCALQMSTFFIPSSKIDHRFSHLAMPRQASLYYVLHHYLILKEFLKPSLDVTLLKIHCEIIFEGNDR